jgi:uncharacterized protein YndB with AHSA1/START domain
MNSEIRKTILVNATPDMVFKALTDEKELLQWFPNQGAKMEARAGGTIELKMQRPDTGENHIIWGRIIEILPESRLVIFHRKACGALRKEGEVMCT